MNRPHTEADLVHFCWNSLQQDFNLSDEKIDLLRRYAKLLVEWNRKFNLTAILDEPGIVNRHFYDSLAVTRYIDFNKVTGICDVGTGAGFPGLPLKIVFPHITAILVEVSGKRRCFLQHIVDELGLKDVVISPLDWGTFVRTTEYAVDYIFARASLQPGDLIRMFKPSSFYNSATLIYWASGKWEPQKKESVYCKKEISYLINEVKRKYVFFSGYQ